MFIIIVQRSNDDGGAVSVDIAPINGTAISGKDYKILEGTIQFKGEKVFKITFGPIRLLKSSVFKHRFPILC